MNEALQALKYKNNEDIVRIVSIYTKDNDERLKVATQIHKQLKGNQDYIDSNILLNIESDRTVLLFQFKECKTLPKLNIELGAENNENEEAKEANEGIGMVQTDERFDQEEAKEKVKQRRTLRQVIDVIYELDSADLDEMHYSYLEGKFAKDMDKPFTEEVAMRVLEHAYLELYPHQLNGFVRDLFREIIIEFGESSVIAETGFGPLTNEYFSENMAKVIDPKEAANQAHDIVVNNDGDPEASHIMLDTLMLIILDSLGYGELVSIFKESKKRYA